MNVATYATMPDICEERGYVGASWTSTTANASDVDTDDLVATVEHDESRQVGAHHLVVGVAMHGIVRL